MCTGGSDPPDPDADLPSSGPARPCRRPPRADPIDRPTAIPANIPAWIAFETAGTAPARARRNGGLAWTHSWIGFIDGPVARNSSRIDLMPNLAATFRNADCATGTASLPVFVPSLPSAYVRPEEADPRGATAPQRFVPSAVRNRQKFRPGKDIPHVIAATENRY